MCYFKEKQINILNSIAISEQTQNMYIVKALNIILYFSSLQSIFTVLTNFEIVLKRKTFH